MTASVIDIFCILILLGRGNLCEIRKEKLPELLKYSTGRINRTLIGSTQCVYAFVTALREVPVMAYKICQTCYGPATNRPRAVWSLK